MITESQIDGVRKLFSEKYVSLDFTYGNKYLYVWDEKNTSFSGEKIRRIEMLAFKLVSVNIDKHKKINIVFESYF
jgi:hypothetical protein